MAYDALGDLDWLPSKSPKRTIFIQRLTLTCSHIKLWGPFTNMNNEKLVGDHVACDVCPRVKQVGSAQRPPQFQLVVKTEAVDERNCSPAWIEAGLL